MSSLALYVGDGRTLTHVANVEAVDAATFAQLQAADRARFADIAERYAALDADIAQARKTPMYPSITREFSDELTTPEAEAGIAVLVHPQE